MTVGAITMLKQLQEAFKDITYYDEPHVYTINGSKSNKHGKPIKSVTGLLGEFKEKFDADYWAQRKADEEGVTKQDKLKEWELINKIANVKGTIVHEYIENLLARKIFPYPTDYVNSELESEESRKEVREKVNACIDLADKFISDISGKLLPIESELVVGDDELGVCGMVDQLFFNFKANEFQIWDWKTNKRLERRSRFGNKLKGKLSHLDECEFVIYSLQLAIYREIIRLKTDIDVGRNYIVWFFEKNSNYEVIECLDLQKEARYILFGEDFEPNLDLF